MSIRSGIQSAAVILVIFASLLSSNARAQVPTRAEIEQTLNRAKTGALALRQGDSHWNMPLYMGTTYVAQSYLFRAWLTPPNAREEALKVFDTNRMQTLLFQTQLADGSWAQVSDPNLNHGSLDATIMSYWALKAIGVKADDERMVKARNFVVANGGLEKASAFGRIVAALFGQLSWSQVPWAPLFFVNPNNPSFFNIALFPQWVRPHIVPISYLRSMHVQRDLGPQFAIPELHASGVQPPALDPHQHRGLRMRKIVEQLLAGQTRLGSWGGYTSATLFTAAALSDYDAETQDPVERPKIQASIKRGLRFVDALYIGPKNPSAYLGTVCDGRYWDSILVLQGLASFDPNFEGRDAAANYLLHAQVANGGIPFGREFESTPDIDDTAEFITTLSLAGGADHRAAAKRAVDWLISMQNDDGGWGAFDRNNVGNFLLKEFAGGLSDSATLFDPSTPDVTGHALEALGSVGLTVQNSAVARRAAAYLRSTVEANVGLWPGRWGVNYIYGTTAAVSGLLRAGVPASDPLIKQALDIIESRQNADGGFGESTESYLVPESAGRGISTASQTAWALMALIRGGRTDHASVQAGVKYLMGTLGANGRWIDASVTGTGHSGVVYLVYPSYPVAFPMIALSEYLKATAPAPITPN